MTWQNEYLKMIEDCEKRESLLSVWERSFIDSVKRQLENGRVISAKQSSVLDMMWERVTDTLTSPERQYSGNR